MRTESKGGEEEEGLAGSCSSLFSVFTVFSGPLCLGRGLQSLEHDEEGDEDKSPGDRG